MKVVRIPIVLILVSLCTYVAGTGQAEAFGWYRANDPVQIDRCYRGPAWDYMAPYYMSRRYHRSRCYGYCCRR